MEANLAIDNFIKVLKDNEFDPKEIASIVVQILENSKIIHFARILELEEIRQLQFDEFKCYYTALQIFSTGTYRQYIALASDLPPLTEAMEKKLKLLTLLTMVTTSKSILYDDLMEELDLHDVRHLEDLIIEAIYGDLIVAKLDQKNRRLEVDRAEGRDFQPENMQRMIEVFEEWMGTAEATASCCEELIAKANADSIENARLRDIRHKKLLALLLELKLEKMRMRKGDAEALFKDVPDLREKRKADESDEPSTSMESVSSDQPSTSRAAAARDRAGSSTEEASSSGISTTFWRNKS